MVEARWQCSEDRLFCKQNRRYDMKKRSCFHTVQALSLQSFLYIVLLTIYVVSSNSDMDFDLDPEQSRGDAGKEKKSHLCLKYQIISYRSDIIVFTLCPRCPFSLSGSR